MTFPFSENLERTNLSFRNKEHPEHHNETTIIEKTSLDLVNDVPVEYMHLICLGVVRKLLSLLTKGKKCPARLKSHQVEAISNHLKLLEKHKS